MAAVGWIWLGLGVALAFFGAFLVSMWGWTGAIGPALVGSFCMAQAWWARRG
jgi:hypothetical protein